MKLMNVEKFTNSLWKLQIIGWLIYFVLMFLTYLSVETTETLLEIFLIKAQRALGGFLISCILWQIYERVLDRNSYGRNIAVIFFSSIAFGIVWTILQNISFTLILPDYDFYKYLHRQPRVALIFAVTLIAWSAIYLGIKFWQQSQKERENALQARVLAEKAQLEMLRYQVNPHFLFNAMNSIRASIDEDKVRAKQMVTQLSEFLRHSLLSGEKKEVPLREELEAVENYLRIEKIRFEENLEIEFDVDEDAKRFRVPGFILNPLVENAIKHGFQTSPKPLRIQIRAHLRDDELTLEVVNTGRLENEKVDSRGTKIGLNNVRERLERLFPEKSSLNLFERNNSVVAKVLISGN